MTTSVAAAGEVSVEGEHLGRIEGFRFVPDTTEGQTDQKAVLSAALRALRQDLPARLQAFTNSRRRRAGVRFAVARLLGRRPGRAPAAERRHPGAQGRGAAVRPARRTGARGSAQARRRLGRDAHSSRPQRIDGCPRHGGAAGRRARHHLPALRGPGRAAAPADRAAARRAQRRGPQGAGAARRAGRRLFALLPEHAEAGADPPARRALDDREQPRDHPAAAGRGPHLDGSAAGRASAISTPPSATCRWATTPSAPTWSSAWRRWRAMPCAKAARARARGATAAAAEEARARRRPATAAAAAPPSTDEISEWAIVAAAFGESEPAPAEAPSPRPPPKQPAADAGRAPPSEPAQAEGTVADEPSRPPKKPAIEETKAEEAPVEAKPEEATAGSSRRRSRREPKSQGRTRPRRQARGRCRPAGSAPRRR